MNARPSRFPRGALFPLACLAVLLGVPDLAHAAAQVDVPVTSVGFPGSVMVGQVTSERHFRLTSVGTDLLRFPKWKLAGHAADFQLGGCSLFIAGSVDLPPGEWCDVYVSFQPKAAGPRTATLLVDTSDPLQPHVAIVLSGNAIAGAPDLQVTATAINFGLNPVHVLSAPQIVTLRSVGSSPLRVTSITAADSLHFVVQPHSCTVLAPASTCTVEVKFRPGFVTLHESRLTIASDDPQGVVEVALSGTGGAPHLDVAPQLDFGWLFLGYASMPREVVVRNVTPPGMGHLRVTGVSLYGPQAADFRVLSIGSCADVPEGGSCTLSVQFLPRGSGPSSTALHITSNSDGAPGNVRGMELLGAAQFDPPAPPALPTGSDRQFVTAGSPSTCTVKGTPVMVGVAVTRAFGSRNPGLPATPPPTLAAAVASGALAPAATIELMTFHQGPASTHFVRLDGAPLPNGAMAPTPGAWTLQTVSVPVTQIRFPPVGPLGGAPPPAAHLVTVVPDPADAGSCVSVAWARISVKVVSPVILVHGDGSNGRFFARQGMTAALGAAGIPNDSSVNLGGGSGSASVAANAATLQTLLPRIARSFGVNSVHLVTHSKGGLDARLWLSINAVANAAGPAGFRVLSLTTLGTPHLGSPLADLELAVAGGAMVGGLPIGPALIAFRPSAADLSTVAGAAFNPPLPGGADYRMLAADADALPDLMIRSAPVDEYAAARRESGLLATSFAQDMAATGASARTDELLTSVHSFVRGTRGVTVLPIPIHIPGVPLLTTLLALQIPGPPMANDLLVRADSALGAPVPFLPALGSGASTVFGDHAAVAGPGVAAAIVPLVIATDTSRGDLR